MAQQQTQGLGSSSAFPNPISAVPHKEALEKMRVLMECVAACENCADRSVEVRLHLLCRA
jgi:hypothetical protein